MVVDGERLIDICKEYEIGVSKSYQIDENYLTNLETAEPIEVMMSTKVVTRDDIINGILRPPEEIIDAVGNDKIIKITFEEGIVQELKIDGSKYYVVGAKPIFREYGVIDDGGEVHEKIAEWSVSENIFNVSFSDIKKETKTNILEKLKSTFKVNFTREVGTSIFVGGNEKLLCRYSKYYKRKDLNYWFGITQKDVSLIDERNITNLAFFCDNKWLILIGGDRFLSELDKMNVSKTDTGEIRHYHVHFIDYGDKVMWYLKGGKGEILENIYRINTA